MFSYYLVFMYLCFLLYVSCFILVYCIYLYTFLSLFFSVFTTSTYRSLNGSIHWLYLFLIRYFCLFCMFFFLISSHIFSLNYFLKYLYSWLSIFHHFLPSLILNLSLFISFNIVYPGLYLSKVKHHLMYFCCTLLYSDLSFHHLAQ